MFYILEDPSETYLAGTEDLGLRPVGAGAWNSAAPGIVLCEKDNFGSSHGHYRYEDGMRHN